jgi:AraC family transcriptional regulator, regulatory protein of adaptative response / methylated-DNA-[protein]-cysteine methyltransferase
MIAAKLSLVTPTVLDDETRWRAVTARDDAFDGMFVTGVRSTGIYCRPSCPARQPARERVVFFETPAQAEAAGFRACKRCDPRGEKRDRRQLVREVAAYLDGENDAPVTLAALGRQFGVSPYQLQRNFKRIIGVSPHEYAVARRVERLKGELRNGRDVTGALYEAGYGSSSRLYESAPATLGMTPGAYGRGGLGMRIAYTIVDSSVGRVLVAGTERGVCSVGLRDDDETLEARLRREYPAAEIARWSGDENDSLRAWADAILKHVEEGRPSLDLPLDIQVTAFQGRVYSALRSIANGETRSYSAIARQIGEPKAARAVARACATNPVPVTVPCHRVVREDGDIGGYGGGVERKRKLLATEGATLREPQGDASRASARPDTGDASRASARTVKGPGRDASTGSLHGGQAARAVTKAR